MTMRSALSPNSIWQHDRLEGISPAEEARLRARAVSWPSPRNVWCVRRSRTACDPHRSEDVVFLEGRHVVPMPKGEGAAMVERERLDDRDCLLCKRARAEDGSEHNWRNGHSRPRIKAVKCVGQLGLGHARLRAPPFHQV